MKKLEIPKDTTEKMKYLRCRYNKMIDLKRFVLKTKPADMMGSLSVLDRETETLIYYMLCEDIRINRWKKNQSKLNSDIDEEIQKRV